MSLILISEKENEEYRYVVCFIFKKGAGKIKKNVVEAEML